MSAQRKLTPDMYINKKFGRLYITGPEVMIPKSSGYNDRKVYADCDCGRKHVLISISKIGEQMSCGCLLEEAKEKFSQGRLDGTIKTVSGIDSPKYVHGDSVVGSEYYNLHHIWTGMRRRCNNPNDKSYPDYGGRGIKVCPEWDNDYRVFKKWALENGYLTGLSIDRLDNNEGYYPENCRWAGDVMQANNKTNNAYITVNGVTHTKAEWARFYGLDPQHGIANWSKQGKLSNQEVIERFQAENRPHKPFIIMDQQIYEEGARKLREKGENKNE